MIKNTSRKMYDILIAGGRIIYNTDTEDILLYRSDDDHEPTVCNFSDLYKLRQDHLDVYCTIAGNKQIFYTLD